MERKEISVIEIFRSVKDGQISIDKAWHEFGDAIKQYKTRNSNESLALLNLYIRYCGYLHQYGYWKDECQYLDQTYQVLMSQQGILSHEQYENRCETIISKRANVAINLGDYATAIKMLKELLYRYPSKNVYKNMYINALRSRLNKIFRPLTIVFCLICLILVVLRHVFDIKIFPYWIFVVVWGAWLLTCVAFLLIPTYAKYFVFKNN